jgi:hypothetical protein
MRVVIPSRGRQDSIGRLTLSLFPAATVVVAEVEKPEYVKAGIPEAQIVTHPGAPQITSASLAKKWILDHFEDEVIVIVDDDIRALISFAGWNAKKYTDPANIMQILENSAECARGFGTSMFGFRQQGNPLVYRPFDPFTLHSWVSTVIGFIGRGVVEFDTSMATCSDIDLSLQCLRKNRCTFIDSRYWFDNIREKNKGGNTSIRTEERYHADRAIMKRKWGKFIEVKSDTKTTERIVLHVDRRQSLSMT